MISMKNECHHHMIQSRITRIYITDVLLLIINYFHSPSNSALNIPEETGIDFRNAMSKIKQNDEELLISRLSSETDLAGREFVAIAIKHITSINAVYALWGDTGIINFWMENSLNSFYLTISICNFMRYTMYEYICMYIICDMPFH